MQTRVVSIANQKGGVGKTTTVVNLAAGLAELGQRILVIDADPQANATSGLGLERQEGVSLYPVLMREQPLLDLIRHTAIDNLDMLPSELDLAGAEIDVARMDGYLQILNMAMAPLLRAARYDFVLIDCPPSLGILTMNALTASHAMLLPIQCEYYALEGLSVVSRIIHQLRESRANPELGVEGIVMTMFDGRTRLATDVVAEVREHFGDTVFDTVIPRNVRLGEAPSYGQPVMQFDPACAGAVAYRALAREFLARTRPDAAATPVTIPAA